MSPAFRKWSVVAAPRFMGRLAGVEALVRYARGGGPALSPHLIPQHSLHSVSALSALCSPAGNRIWAWAAASIRSPKDCSPHSRSRVTPETAGVWLVATAWDPEPVIDQQGNMHERTRLLRGRAGIGQRPWREIARPIAPAAQCLAVAARFPRQRVAAGRRSAVVRLPRFAGWWDRAGRISLAGAGRRCTGSADRRHGG